MNRSFQASVYLFIFELLGCNCITLDIQNEEDRMGESFWINYPSIWCTWVNMPCEFLCPAFGLVNRIHGYLLCLVLLMIWYSLLTEIEWYFFVFCGIIAGSAIMTMCMESLWSLLCSSRSCACLLCPVLPGTWYAVGTQLICVQGTEELDSDHLVSLFFSVWSVNSHPRGTHSLQLLWRGLPNFTSEIFLLLSDRSSQSGNFTSMSHKATHTVNLRLLSIPLCLGLVPPRFFPDVECFQVVYQTLSFCIRCLVSHSHNLWEGAC